ncbi:hypothetical protein Wxf_02209 [Wolbachia endosymbiont of Armadillidium vulgare]|nr:hypothetical protein Wxf_01127 [Wolbachia endosymbiont of Armadillidium vulgare]OJH32755.1 hypothetical protein Wxf_02209 [Wolbachia endosymbiont of Armadillidium vulgare]
MPISAMQHSQPASTSIFWTSAGCFIREPILLFYTLCFHLSHSFMKICSIFPQHHKQHIFLAQLVFPTSFSLFSLFASRKISTILLNVTFFTPLTCEIFHHPTLLLFSPFPSLKILILPCFFLLS